MDTCLIEAARKEYAEFLFDTARKSYSERNQKLITVAAEYLTEAQKAELRRNGYAI